MLKPSLPEIRGVSSPARPLGSTEHLSLLLDKNVPVHFAVTAKVLGRSNVDDWRKALDRVQRRHPLLSVTIGHAPGAAPWFRQGKAASIPMRVFRDDPDKRWAAEVSEELARPIDPDHAPLVRAVLVHAPDSAAITIVAHHSIADGMSIAFLLRDILRALSGGVLTALSLVPAMEEMLPKDDAVSGPVVAEGQEMEASASKPGIWRERDDARPQVRGLRLAPPLTALLKERARREGTTVHGALCAALSIAGRRVLPSWADIPVRIMSPVNMRQMLGVGEDFGVFVSAASSTSDPSQTDFWEIARKAKADVAPGQTSAVVAAFVSNIQEFIGCEPNVSEIANFAAIAFAAEAMVTNLGHLPFPARFANLEVQAIWGPCVLRGFNDDHTLGVATVNGSLCLAHTSHIRVDGLLEALEEVLTKACAGS